IKAVDYITTLKTRDGLNVVATNNSWGGGGYSKGLLDAITRAANANILFIAAAGNNGSNNDTSANYPSNYNTTTDGASYDSVIAVAAIDSSGRLASFSNYGANTVDIAAPGVGIYSTLPYNSYGSYDGTSMATPHVTGAAALYASAHPGASAAEIRAAILTKAIPTASLAGKTATGGRLDVYGALFYNPTGPLVAPSGLQATVISSSRIYLSWTDTNNNEKGYEIQQRIKGTSTFQTIANTPVNATSYEVANLSAQTSYEFQIRAFNNDNVSDYSTVASATTARAVLIPYTDDFSSDPTAPGSVWAFSGTQWDYDSTNQILKQTSSQVTTVERRAMMVGVQGVPTEVKAKVRIDEWKPGEYAKAGVALATDPRNAQGYSLVFTGRQAASNQLGLNDGSGTHIEFVNDYVAWSGWTSQGGVSVAFPIQVDQHYWYWFDMKLDSGKLYGKVWRDGTPEPAWPTRMDQAKKISADAATITFDAAGHGWSRSGGVAALNGGYSGYFQSQDISYSKASFDDVTAQIGAPVSGGKGSKTRSLGLGAIGAGEVGIIPPTVIAAVAPSDSESGADLADLARSRQRARRPWEGMRLV
ncbi:MAG: S8 family serine peptidase, partial [Isosphaeraceae bacterium]|nr:S8 family serine peptidase [Isosphaeraceae bacterium]